MNKKIVGEVTQMPMGAIDEVYLRAGSPRPLLPSPSIADSVVAISTPHKDAESAFRILKERDSIAQQAAVFYGVDSGTNEQTSVVVIAGQRSPRSIINWTDDDRRWVAQLERNLPPRTPSMQQVSPTGRIVRNFPIQLEASRLMMESVRRFTDSVSEGFRQFAFGLLESEASSHLVDGPRFPTGGLVQAPSADVMASLTIIEEMISVCGLFSGPDFKYAREVAMGMGYLVPPDATGFTSSDLRAAGISYRELQAKVEIRIATAKRTPVRIVKRHRRSYAGIPVVDVLTEYGERMTVPAISVVGLPDETGGKL